MASPALSILIPNFNNGRQSSRSGSRDFIADLFQSLLDTLIDDPTPLEILVADDGSTDDSLATCRTWSERRWPGGPRRGERFCSLLELPHCGVLSIVANRLTEMARGDICCRLDGDIVIHTPRWAERLCQVFEEGPPDLGVVGPKQLGLDGKIHSAGCWILHPRGHHHIAQGAAPALISRSLEVDHVMGCFYGHRRKVWEDLGGYDERFLRGQTVDFGLRARLAGWRTWFIPVIEFMHAHADRNPRATAADSGAGVDTALNVFADKWGFDRLAADLAVVAERYAGTPLLWNARFFGPGAPWPPRRDGQIDIRASEWSRFAQDHAFREAVQFRQQLVQRVQRRLEPGPRVLQVGCGSGLLCHLLAGEGLHCTGVDADPNLIELARTVAASETYAHPPRYALQSGPSGLPAEDGSADLILLLGVLEFHPNPVGLLKEAHRVLDEHGLVLILARRRRTLNDADHDALHGYLANELVMQLHATRRFTAVMDQDLQAPSDTLVLIGRRRSDVESFYQRGGVPAAAVGASE